MVPKKCTVVKVSFQNAKSRRAHIGVLGAIHMSCHTGGEGVKPYYDRKNYFPSVVTGPSLSPPYEGSSYQAKTSNIHIL